MWVIRVPKLFIRFSHQGIDTDHMEAHKRFSRIDNGPRYVSVLSYSEIAYIAEEGFAHYINSLVVVYENDSRFNASDLVRLSLEANFSPLMWVLFTVDYAPESYQQMRIPINCQFVVAEGSDAVGYRFAEIYDTVTIEKLSNSLGSWSPEKGLSMTEEEFWQRRQNLRGTVFNISTTMTDPCRVHSFEYSAGSVLKCIHVRIFEVMARGMNFSINWVRFSRTGGFGLEVLTPDIHFTIFDINIVTDDIVAITWPTVRTPVEIFTQYAGRGISWLTFVSPFSKSMWIAIFVWHTFSAAVMSAIDMTAGSGRKTRKTDYIKFWLNYVFVSYSAFCLQSEGRNPERVSKKIILLLIFLLPTALMPGYSAVLTSYLTMKVNEMPFTNLEGLVKSGEYKLGYHTTFNLSIFLERGEKNELVETLFRDIVVPQNELPEFEVDGLRRMCREKYSFICLSATAAAVQPDCPFYKLDRPFLNLFGFLPVRKDSPYKDLFNGGLRRLMYSGLIMGEAVRIIQLNKKEIFAEAILEPIVFENIITIIVCWGFGILLSLILLLVEISFISRPDKTTEVHTVQSSNIHKFGVQFKKVRFH
ncbi:UNVERIFIED_CONTAM: hypothetical protein PYX00_004106 [Menopon gallinae]|uniref:Ionotropic glutamate receptor C-terminal domain-containing protein n=1 Tax=Menopon gallinae TaxID=328185 RepID=A0AAW2I511_9NEOP